MPEAGCTYGAWAILPPFIAIVLAIWKKQVIPALFLGVFAGAVIINGWNPVKGLLDTFATYVVARSLADPWNIGIIVFCLAIGGMIGVISRMGGTRAIADAIVSKAHTVRSTQLAAALMGVAIFFDDYANAMIVGNTMRPVTDKQRISREKLAFIVDTTAAPVSSMAPVSTWIATELGLIAGGLATAGIEANALGVFARSIPYRFYSLFALALVFILIIMRRDFGPMLRAERRARATGDVFAPGASPIVTTDTDILPPDDGRGSLWFAVIPIGLFTMVTIFGLWYNGRAPGRQIYEAFGKADASVVLTWAAFISSIAAILTALVTRRLTLARAMDAWIGGVKTMLVAAMVLALAFALKAVTKDLQLAEWIVAATKGCLSGAVLPFLVFLTAMVIAFATGTSWGTNAILMPIVIPLAAGISGAAGTVTPLIAASIGAVLTGAVFGDHCSPISDTTILSSTASGSDHVDHVRTQIPYALTAAGCAAVFGFLPAGFGCPAWISLILGFTALVAIVRFIGRLTDTTQEG